MLLPDDLIIKNNCSKEMIRLHKKTNGSIIATKRVERKTVSRWGILSIKNKRKFEFLNLNCCWYIEVYLATHVTIEEQEPQIQCWGGS